MAQLFSNNAVSLLAHPVGPLDTQIMVVAGTGNLYPTPIAPDDYFLVTLEDQQATVREILKVTSRTGDVFTVVRAQEQTSVRSWPQITLVDLRDTAGTMKRLQQVVNHQVTMTLGEDNLYRINTTENFAPRSTQLWIGGLRQCLGKDYIEQDSHTIKLLFTFEQADLDAGLNIVLDFYRM